MGQRVSPMRRRSTLSSAGNIDMCERNEYESRPHDEEGAAAAQQTVSYDSRSHVSVLFQMHGSVWPSVLPFCIANLALMGIIILLQKFGIDLTAGSDTSGISVTSVLVSFLIVSRSQIVHHRFLAARNMLANMNKNCRELIHYTALLSQHDQSVKAKTWRHDVAFRLILLLRTSLAALEFQSTKRNVWDIVPEEWANDVRKSIYMHGFAEHDMDADRHSLKRFIGQRRWAQGKRTLTDENFRIPVLLSYDLRDAINAHRKDVIVPSLHPLEEVKLFGFVTDIMTDFQQLQASITTPFPFPLVQMARTFLFFFIFSLPFHLCHDIKDPIQNVIQIAIILFFATYGFIGLEYVSIELEDPFGDDPNDFDDLAFAQMVFEDIYITIGKVDGVEYARNLRRNVKGLASKSSLNPEEKRRSEEEKRDSVLRPRTRRQRASALYLY